MKIKLAMLFIMCRITTIEGDHLKGKIMTTRKLVRKAFKDIGYKVSFSSNPFNRDLCTLSFNTLDNKFNKPISFNGVYPAQFRQNHVEAFDLYLNFKGALLECTE